MKKISNASNVRTKFNQVIVLSVIMYLLLLVNQITNLRYLGLWKIWNLSGYGAMFVFIPTIIIQISMIHSLFRIKGFILKTNFYIWFILIFFINISLLFCAFFTNMFTWM